MNRVQYEGVVAGVPVAWEANSRKRWQQIVKASVLKTWPDEQPVTIEPVSVTVGYYNTLNILDRKKVLDVDNMCKPILDALNELCYKDDEQVITVISYKRNKDELDLTDPSGILLNAIATLPSFVYVKVEMVNKTSIPKIIY